MSLKRSRTDAFQTDHERVRGQAPLVVDDSVLAKKRLCALEAYKSEGSASAHVRRSGSSGKGVEAAAPAANMESAESRERLDRLSKWKEQQLAQTNGAQTAKLDETGGQVQMKRVSLLRQPSDGVAEATLLGLFDSAPDSSTSGIGGGTAAPRGRKYKNRKSAQCKAAAAVASEDKDPLDAYMLTLDEAQAPAKAEDASRLWNDESVFEESDILVDTDISSMNDAPHAKRAVRKQVALLDASKRAELHSAPIRKDLYIEAPAIAKLSDEEVARIRTTQLGGCKVTGEAVPRPILEWSQCGLPSEVLSILRQLKYERPFPIQCQALPCIMQGRDLIGSAKTGSGKTLAFLLPCIRHVLAQLQLSQELHGPIAIIMAPTRELVQQLTMEARRLMDPLGISVVSLYGGAPVGEQISALRRGCEVVIGTPGRIIDMLCTNQGRLLSLARVSFVVLDEADRMFDLGFGQQMSEVMKNVRADRQCVMFSATFPREIAAAAKEWLAPNALHIVVGNMSTVSDDVTQIVRVLDSDEDKYRELLRVLGQWYGRGLILVFDDRRESVDMLYAALLDDGYPALVMHGGVEQVDRAFTLQDFKQGKKSILIATSVCARGLDVSELKVVINYTAPHHFEDYVHRCGRVGRAGKRGVAYTFMHARDERRYAPDIVKALRKSSSDDTEIPQRLLDMASEFNEAVNTGEEKVYRKRGYVTKGYSFDGKDAASTLALSSASDMIAAAAGGGNAMAADVQLSVGSHAGDDADAAVEQLLKGQQPVAQTPAELLSKIMSVAASGSSAASVALSEDKTSAASGEKKAQSTLAVAPVVRLKDVQLEQAKKTLATVKRLKAGKAKEETIKRHVEKERKLDERRLASEAQKKQSVVQARLNAAMQQTSAAGGGGVAGAGAALSDGTVVSAEDMDGIDRVVLKKGERVFSAKVEINDFPDEVRKRVCFKTTLHHVRSNYEVRVSQRGCFVPPGRKVKEGEEKLHILVEGTSPNDVRGATREIQRLLSEEASSFIGKDDGGAYAKFQVV